LGIRKLTGNLDFRIGRTLFIVAIALFMFAIGFSIDAIIEVNTHFA
jgi:hypothetical protein